MKYLGKEPLFIQIANYYENLIRIGVYKSGDALPSVREIALSDNVNPNTVAHAFSLLIERGIVVSVPKKGYFVTENARVGKNENLRNIIRKLINDGNSIDEIEQILIEIKKEEGK